MTKVMAVILLICITQAATSQMPEKFVKAMESRVQLIDSAKTADGWIDLANAFERIAVAEKNQWLPYYYAAFCNIMGGYMKLPQDGMMGDNSALVDPLAEKSQELISRAEELEKDNSEIWCVKKMAISFYMMGNVMQRYTQGAKAADALEKARQLNPDNPRVYLLEGQDKFYTPEQFGGSKTEAKELLEKAGKLYETFTAPTPIHPQWGKNQVTNLLSQLTEANN